MLVLSRKTNESIRVGDNIEVTVVSVRGNRVKLAISAPKDVRIKRSELTSSANWSSTSTESMLPVDPPIAITCCS